MCQGLRTEIEEKEMVWVWELRIENKDKETGVKNEGKKENGSWFED